MPTQLSEERHSYRKPITPRPPTRGTERLTVLTFATSTSGFLCDTLLSAASYQLRITLLGHGQAYMGNYQKLETARQHLAGMDMNDIVLFVDVRASF